MAILPNYQKSNKVPAEGNKIASPTAGPKPLTLEEYRRRQIQKKEKELTKIPKTQKPPHRRGGKLVRLRRKLAALRGVINSDSPPSWQQSCEIWAEIDRLEEEMSVHRRTKKEKHHHHIH